MLFTRFTRGSAFFISFALFAAACADEIPTTAGAPSALTRISSSAAIAASPAKYLVYFTSDAIPADFSSRIAALGATVDATFESVGIAVVDGLSAAAAVQLAGNSDVSAVDPDNVFQFLDDPSRVAMADATDAVAASPFNPTTAAFYPFQWHLRAIGANAAWQAGNLGSPAVRVAILDTGIDYLHPDLAGRVDLANSASFVPAEDAFVPILFPGRLAFTDLHFHGTHVASTVSSNAVVTAGVSSMTSLMAVKVLNVNGVGATSAILAGIVFATDRGANVINLSLGVEDLLSRKEKFVKEFERMTDRAFQYAFRNGVTVIASAGNESQNLDTKQTFKGYCGSTQVLCVSATGPTSQGGIAGPWQNIDAPASYTNFGVKEIDVAAPGGNAASFVWGACSRTSLVIPVCQTALVGLGLQGTSQAAPHASGEAALVLAKEGSMPPGALRDILMKSADDLGSNGKDAFYGRGRINVRSALGL